MFKKRRKTMTYPKIYYQEVFKIISEKYGISYPPKWFYGAAMCMVRRMFDDDITIAEIADCLPEASEKRKWPIGTGLLKRIHQVILKNRLEHKTTKIDRGILSIGSVLSERR